MRKHNRTRSLYPPKTCYGINFITKYASTGVSDILKNSEYKIFLEQSKQVKDILKTCDESIQPSNSDLPITTEWDIDLLESEERKMERYMRSRWGTVLFVLKQVMQTHTNQESKRQLEIRFLKALKQRLKEKMIFEITNPSLAKIMRSRTPPSDAPRKIREDYRKAHPEEEDHFPDIVLQLKKEEKKIEEVSKVKENNTTDINKMPNPKIEEKRSLKPRPIFPYRSTVDNPKYYHN